MAEALHDDSHREHSDLPVVRAVVVSSPRAPVAVTDEAVRKRGNRAAALARYIDNRLLVVGIMLVVGPLGLPLVWLNRRFSVWSKVFWTVVYVLVTIVFPIALVWYVCNTLLQPLVEALRA